MNTRLFLRTTKYPNWKINNNERAGSLPDCVNDNRDAALCIATVFVPKVYSGKRVDVPKVDQIVKGSMAHLQNIVWESWKEISDLQLEIERHNRSYRTHAKLSSLRSVCFVCRLVVLLPNFVVVIQHIKFLWNHSVWTSNITDIDRDGWNITRRWCQDSYIFPRDNIFTHCCALRENITLLAVHRNVIFHDRPGQYLYINPLARTWLPLWNAKCKHNAIDLFTNFMHTILACLRFERRSNNSCIRKVDSN